MACLGRERDARGRSRSGADYRFARSRATLIMVNRRQRVALPR